jgi:hypothetical protein
MSPRIQNEFIQLAASNVRVEILKNIKERKYFSIMFDATPDTSHQEQISQIIRTVKVDEDGCQIEENFIDFIHFEGKTGLELSKMIMEKLKVDGLDINNCRGQGYDNGANMSGAYQGVQARILEINKCAFFVPCAAHSLNLVGQNAASKILQAKLILGQIQNLFIFFSGSTQRWSLLHKYLKKTLKGHSATRWSSKSDAVSTLLVEFKNVCDALTELVPSPNSNHQTSADANSQLTQIFNFKFLLGISIWDTILSRIQIVNLALQHKNQSLEKASMHLKGLLQFLKKFKQDGFDKSFDSAKQLAEQMEIDINSGFDYRCNRGLRPSIFRDE